MTIRQALFLSNKEHKHLKAETFLTGVLNSLLT